MRIPNFRSDEGAILYKDTVGKVIAPQVAELLIRMASQVVGHQTQRVLDVACGPGTVALELAKQFPAIELTGIDASSAMIAQCIQSAKETGLTNVHFREMNANTIQFDDEAFDLVTCNLAFPFFGKPLESMQGFYHSLRNGGHVILSVPGRHTWEEFFSVAEEVLGDAVRMARPFLMKIGQAEALPRAIEEAGFKEVSVTHHKIPFSFANGEDVLAFFDTLFALLAYAPPEVQSELAQSIDDKFPQGFLMHYEAVFVHAIRD